MRICLAIAGAIGAVAAACGAPADPVAACLRAERAGAPDALARCRAAARGGAMPARAALVKLAFRAGQLDEVLAAAAALPATVEPRDREAAGRIVHLAGEAALSLRREAEAWPHFERAFALTEGVDPPRRAQVALRLADHALDTGDVDRVATFLHAAIESADTSRVPGDAMSARIDAAAILLRLGDVRTAEVFLAGARELLDRAPDDPGVVWFRQGYFLHAGDAAALRGRTATGAELHRQCVAEIDRREAAQDGSDADVAVRCHQRLGALALAPPADLDRAEAALAAATARTAEADRAWAHDPDRDAGVEHLRAQVDLGRGRTEAAFTRWAALWTTPMGAGTRVQIALTYAAALAGAGDAAGAERVLREAFDAVVALRDGHQVEEARRGLPAGLRQTAEALVPLALARGDRAAAFAIIEETQRRDFRDHLLAPLTDAPAIGGAPSRDLAALFGAVRRTEAARRRLDSPVATAPGPHAPAIVGFWSDAAAVYRLTAPGGVPAIERIADRAWIEARVDAARAAPEGPAAAELGARLFPPAVLPPREAPLVIVPDPALAGLGFAALPVGTAPLVAHHTLAIAPSFATAWTWAERAGGPPGPAVVLGDPARDLPGAAAEAAAVATRLGVTAQLGPAADRAALEAAAHAGVLHVAAHAGVAGSATVLQLADGDVTVAELVALGLAPRVAVVASCASAAQREDAMWSSTAAALAVAGARAVVGALRSLDDATTRAIVDDFYAAGGAVDAAPALATAQRRARARGVPATAWAFLVVYGAPSSPGDTTHSPER